ncbi:MAG: heavy metal translocating P-type ATPase [Phycisphaerae bacterium]
MSAETTNQRAELEISGMHCAGCVATVEAALRNIPGVADASVNLATERATVAFESGGPPVDTATLIRAVQAIGYQAQLPRPQARLADERQTRREEELRWQRRRIYAALTLGAPVVALHFASQSGPATVSTMPRPLAFVQAALTAAVLMIAAGPMIAGALRALAARSANMDLLVTLGALTAFFSGGVGLLINEPALVMFEAAVMIVVFVSVGKYLEARARGQASAALETLLSRLPREALRVTDGRTETVPIDAVRPQDVLRLAPHTVVPVDGEVLRGRLTVDESMLTGEALPLERTVGDRLFGGTQVADGLAEMRATATGRESTATRIAQLVAQAQASKPPWQRLADRVAAIFVPAIVALALATFAAWNWWGNAGSLFALERMIAVLVVACPCAMGLAIPTAVLVGTTRAAEHGILVRDATALEAAGQVREVLLDKTGTLTLGKPTLEQVELLGDGLEAEVLRYAAALEQLSEHPFARAVAQAAKTRGLVLPEPKDLYSQPGAGLRGRVDDRDVTIGSAAWMEENGIRTSEHIGRADQLAARGQSVIWVALDGRVTALLGLADQLHPESPAAIRELKRLGLRTRLLSGDRHAAVSNVADSLGIDAFEAQLTPQQKLDRVRRLSETGPGLAMVGDGINDAPALAAATVGIAIGTGADVAREAADICLVGHSPRLIAEAIRVSRCSARVMKQNLCWALIYNLVMIPVAVFTMLPAAAAAAAMMCSSLSVVGNALRLRRAI